MIDADDLLLTRLIISNFGKNIELIKFCCQTQFINVQFLFLELFDRIGTERENRVLDDLIDWIELKLMTLCHNKQKH